MSLPISAIKNLELTGVDYRTYITIDENGQQLEAEPSDSQKAILVILEDSIGKMQCVLTQDHFIDLTMLCETLGRNLKGIEPDTSLKIAHALGLECISSLPGLTNYPCIVSPQVLDAEQLYFSSGRDGHYIQLNSKGIQSLFVNAERLNFAKAISQFKPPETMAGTEDEESIRKAVQDFTTLRIKQRLETTLEIPPMPQTSRKIVLLRADPDAGVAELASIVETDPSLAAQVVSWAGSSYYAAPGKINSVHDAVIRVLGFDLVINLALGLSLGRDLQMPSDHAKGITPYWKQAVYCAATAELICRQIPKEHRPEPGLAYLAGLLHNFGYLILGYVFPPHLSLINRYIEANPHVPVHILEYFLIGVTREQLAAWLFSSWNMPEEVVSAVRWQNSPLFEGTNHNYPNVLFIANQLLHGKQLGTGPAEAIPHALLSSLNIEREDLDKATQKIWDNMDHLDSIAKSLNDGL
ncbi:MAG: HDOD domain-containing protein [Pseudomonadota bacterium]|nr:histidine kinase [Gammaproteobacteria bacterium]MEC8010663.1 HDOD domain-containing protein [Pseudomonadota bacterium]|tara:strand:+ start:94972 stop:96372 length:1401 start_codon:yes stop_codon:yes gene_type:complete